MAKEFTSIKLQPPNIGSNLASDLAAILSPDSDTAPSPIASSLSDPLEFESVTMSEATSNADETGFHPSESDLNSTPNLGATWTPERAVLSGIAVSSPETMTMGKIANECGFASEQWARNRRAEVEWIWYEEYPQKAFYNGLPTLWLLERIQELQLNTLKRIPDPKGGYKRGVRKTISQQKPAYTLQTYANHIWTHLGCQPNPIPAPGLKPGSSEAPETPAEEMPQSPELTSELIVYEDRDDIVAAELEDANQHNLADFRTSFGNHWNAGLAIAGQAGQQFGEVLSQRMILAASGRINENMNAFINSMQAPENGTQTPQRRTTKKKS